MAIITISRLLGSDGAAIAERVAQEMSYELITKRTLEKILEQYGLVHLDSFYQSPPRLWSRLDFETRHLVSMLNKTMLGIAKRGDAVILGRGGYAALHNFSGGLHVRVQAPLSVRVKRVLDREGSDDLHRTEKMVRENDKARAIFVNGYYDADFIDANQFHLVLDTSLISIDTATEWIVGAGQIAMSSPPPGTYLAKDIDVDPLLLDTIDNVLMPEE